MIKPMHDRFIEPIKKFADIIIANNTHNASAVEIIKNIVNEKFT